MMENNTNIVTHFCINKEIDNFTTAALGYFSVKVKHYYHIGSNIIAH